MAETKKIKRISIGGQDALDVYDVAAAHTISGYDATAVEAQTVLFANKTISAEEINSLFTQQASVEGGN